MQKGGRKKIDKSELEAVIKVYETVSPEVKMLKAELVIQIMEDKITIISTTPTEMDEVVLKELPWRNDLDNGEIKEKD